MRHVPPSTSSRSARWLATTAFLALITAAGAADALPVLSSTPPQVNSGGGAPIFSSTPTTLTVDINAQRTIIDWSSYNIAPGESVNYFVERNGAIILNRVSRGVMNINGSINTFSARDPGPTSGLFQGGNLWLYSPDGIIFGPNAAVVANDILATTAAPSSSEFLNASNLNFNMTGGAAPITVRGGATLSTKFGALALIAPSITTEAGSNLIGDDAEVFYGAATNFRIRFVSPTIDDAFNIVDFIVPAASDGTPASTALSLAGATKARDVGMYAISRGAAASLLINAPGLITATTSKLGDFGGNIAISTAQNRVEGASFNAIPRTPGATPGGATLGTVLADRYLGIYLETDTSAGDLVADTLRAGANLYTTGRNITVSSATSGIRPDVGNPQNVNVAFDAFGIVTVGTVNAVGQAGLGQSAIGQKLGFAKPSVRATSVTSRDVFFNALTARVDSIAASRNVFGGTSGGLNIGSLTAENVNLSSGGNFTAGSFTAGTLIKLGSRSNLTATSLVAGQVQVGTDLTINLRSVTATGSADLQGGALILGTVTAGADSVIGYGTGLQIDGGLTAPNLTIEKYEFGGPLMILGANTSAEGITNDSFNRIRVTGHLDLYGGLVSTIFPGFTLGPNSDIVVRDLTVDPAKIPKLNFFAGGEHSVLVSGTVRPTGPGIDVRFGDPAQGAVWLPSDVLISGALGTVTGDATAGFSNPQGFRNVEIFARDSVGIGSQRFLDLITATIATAEKAGTSDPRDLVNLDQGKPAGVEPQGSEIGRTFVVASRLSVISRTVEGNQNTGTLARPGGIYLTGEGIDPKSPLLTVGAAQAFFYVNFGPSTGVDAKLAGLSSRVTLAGNESNRAAIHLNGCTIGIGCSLSTPATQFRIEEFAVAADSTTATTAAAIDPPILSPPPAVDEDERDSETVVTGTGNEEIWRNPK